MTLTRRLAHLICDLLQVSLPAPNLDWSRAARGEMSAIESDAEALTFAVEMFWGLGVAGLKCRLLRAAVKLGGGAGPGQALPHVGWQDSLTRWPRALGVASVLIASLLGVAVLAVAGAPARYIAGNFAALGLGLVTLAFIGRRVSSDRIGLDRVLLALSLLLWVAAGFGEAANGASRWLRVGGLTLQPSLLVLPAMVIGFAATQTAMGVLAMVLAAGALALQPDPAMAGALCIGLAAAWISRPGRLGLIALASGVAAWSITLVRGETAAPLPFVDGVLALALDVHGVLGVAVLGALGLLLAPALLGDMREPHTSAAYLTFGGIWTAVIFAGAVGPYPTPVVGYGGSAIVGYLLSLLMLPTRVAPSPAGRGDAAREAPAPVEPNLRLTLT